MAKTVFDEFERPPAADLLGWQLISLDAKAGVIEIAFEGKREFTNPMGYVQGGMVAAMLDDTLGPAIVGLTGGKRFGQTIDLHTHFLSGPYVRGPFGASAGSREWERTSPFSKASSSTATANWPPAPLPAPI